MPIYQDGYAVQHPAYPPISIPLNYNQAGNNGTAGFGNNGDCVITSESPLYKGYEGNYWSAGTISGATFSSTLAGASPSTPYNYGSYNKGPRSSRGGLAGGWGAAGGNIFKIVKSGTSTSWSNGITIYARTNCGHYKHQRARFRAYIFIQSGPACLRCGIMDSLTQFCVPSAQEWHYVDVILGTSDVMSPDFLLSLGPDSGGQTREVWMAWPTIEAVHYGGSHEQYDETPGHGQQFIGINDF